MPGKGKTGSQLLETLRKHVRSVKARAAGMGWVSPGISLQTEGSLWERGRIPSGKRLDERGGLGTADLLNTGARTAGGRQSLGLRAVSLMLYPEPGQKPPGLPRLPLPGTACLRPQGTHPEASSLCSLPRREAEETTASEDQLPRRPQLRRTSSQEGGGTGQAESVKVTAESEACWPCMD